MIIVLLGDSETWDVASNVTLHAVDNIHTEDPEGVPVGVTVQELYDFWVSKGGQAAQ